MIRLATEADIPAILAIYGPYIENTAVSFEYSIPTLEEFTARFRGITARFPWLVWEDRGRVLGYAYASAPFSRDAYRWVAASSIYLSPEVQGRGIGAQLYNALEAVLAEQGYRKTYAVITSDNPASLRFHEARGFRTIGEFPGCGIKFGKLYSVVWMEKALNNGEIPKNFPKRVDQIVNVDRFFS